MSNSFAKLIQSKGNRNSAVIGRRFFNAVEDRDHKKALDYLDKIENAVIQKPDKE